MNERDKLIEQLIQEKGGTREQYLSLLNQIAYHESGHTMSPTIRQQGGGPGRGKFQFEEGKNEGAITAARRTKQYMENKGLKVPKWLQETTKSDSLDATKLNAVQQDMLFLGNMRMHPKADFAKVWKGEESVEDFWANHHWAGSEKDRAKRIDSFAGSMKHYQKNYGQEDGLANIERKQKVEQAEREHNYKLYQASRDNIQQARQQQVQPQLRQPEATAQAQQPILDTTQHKDLFSYMQAPKNTGELNSFNTGGKHEQNPHGGIPIGVGANGKPNTVEEGETSYNFGDDTFIFSDRINTNDKNNGVAFQETPIDNAFALGGNPTDPPTTVKHGTKEYAQAYNDGTFADIPNQLDEIVITADGKTGKNILQDYPHYNSLNAQDKEYWNDNSPIGRSVRRRAQTTKGLAGDAANMGAQLGQGAMSAMQMPQSAMVEGIEGMRGNPSNMSNALPGAKQRVPSDAWGYKDPQGFMQNASNIGMDIFADPTNLIGAGYADDIARGIKGLKKVGKYTDEIAQGLDKYKTNFRDLNELNKFADSYNYNKMSIPSKAIKALGSESTDKQFKNILGQHNKFARGISTNWAEIEARSPQIIKILEKAGIDYKNNPAEAAEYMATHIPEGNTGYGRVGLENIENTKDGLYSSNSYKTAEAYTYGDGYIATVQRPLDFKGTRKDWIKNNDLKKYDRDEYIPGSDNDLVKQGYTAESTKYTSKAISNKVYKALQKDENYTKGLKELTSTLELRDKALANMGYSLQDTNTIKNLYANGKSTGEIKDYLKKHLEDGYDWERIMKDPNNNGILNTEANALAIKADIIKRKKLLDNFNEKEFKLFGESQIKSDKLYKELADIDDRVTSSFHDAPYNHYIFTGKKGEKVFDVVDMKRVEPDKYKNTSRAHEGKYSKGLSKLRIDGNFLTKPLTPFTKNEIKGSTDNPQLYRKIGGKKGLEDLIDKKGAQAPKPFKMNSGNTIDTPFFGEGKRPNENYNGIFAVETNTNNPKYNWTHEAGGTSNYGVAPIDKKTGELAKNIPLEELEVYRKKWLSNNYKKLDKNNLQKELSTAGIQEKVEFLYKWGIRGAVAHDIAADPENRFIIKLIDNKKKK